MTPFRVLLANGEKKEELLLEADSVSAHENTMYFYNGKRIVAALPHDKVIFAVEVQNP